MTTIKSIEEKAKAYDEALKKAKDMLSYKEVRQEDIEYLFPELKESEDEKMIQYFKDLAPFDKADELYEKYGFSHKDAIAWLEKQGGHAKFINGIQVGDKVTRNEDGVLVNLSQLNRVAKKDEKQGKQKPADKVEPKFKVKYAGCEYNVLEVKDIVGVTYYGIEDEPNHIDYVKADNCEIISGGYGIKENGSPYPTKPAVFSEQKPAWSEEDEERLSDAIFFVREYQIPTRDKRLLNAAKETEDWLRTFQDRVQPKQEWSEEDLSMISRIRSIIEKYAFSQSAVDVNGELCEKEFIDADNWLKSLKERVQPQPKQEWTMQDEEELQIALDTLVKAGQHSSAKWLKNVCLVPQNRWKPSDEQIKSLKWLLDNINNYPIGGHSILVVQKLLEQLKAL